MPKPTVGDKINELKPLIGQELAQVRVAGLGERGMRWKVTSLDEKKECAHLTNAEGTKTCKASVMDCIVSPVRPRAQKAAETALAAVKRDPDNKHLERRAEGASWGTPDEPNIEVTAAEIIAEAQQDTTPTKQEKETDKRTSRRTS